MKEKYQKIMSGHCRSGRFAIKFIMAVVLNYICGFTCSTELLNEERIATQRKSNRIAKACIQITIPL